MADFLCAIKRSLIISRGDHMRQISGPFYCQWNTTLKTRLQISRIRLLIAHAPAWRRADSDKRRDRDCGFAGAVVRYRVVWRVRWPCDGTLDQSTNCHRIDVTKAAYSECRAESSQVCLGSALGETSHALPTLRSTSYNSTGSKARSVGLCHDVWHDYTPP